MASAPHGAFLSLRRPLVRVGFAGAHVPVDRFKRIGPPGAASPALPGTKSFSCT